MAHNAVLVENTAAWLRKAKPLFAVLPLLTRLLVHVQLR